MDAIDREMLKLLQADGRLPNNALAEKIRLSPSPCLRRLKRLERDGAITGYRAMLDRRKVGLGLTVFLEIKVENPSHETIRSELQDTFSAMEEVVACHIVSGLADFFLEVVVTDLEHYEEFLMGRLLKNEGVADVQSNIVIRTVKESGPLPLSHLGSS